VIRVPREELLYISPVIPAATGNGLAMRAAMVLEALSKHYAVSLLVVRLYRGATSEIPRALQERCRRTLVTDPSNPGRLERLRLRRSPATRWRNTPFAVVHTFRLAALPFAEAFYEPAIAPPRRWLDLDEIDSAAHRCIADLCRSNGDLPLAAFHEREVCRSEAMEEKAWPTLDRVFVCSSEERDRILRRARVDVRVLPNAVHLPATIAPPRASGVFRFLFIGSLDSYANEDAALYFCREILPRLRQRLQSPFEVRIVGGGATARLRQAAAEAGVRLAGAVPAVHPHYRNADAVVAPIRAGGGTRIRILEAFSHGRAVISTSVGAEGLDVRHERDILIADCPAAFAAACARLAEDRELLLRLAANAFRLLGRSYSIDALRRLLEPAHHTV
jgi:glycosyltransferase involved in cell wall biosynthesis